MGVGEGGGLVSREGGEIEEWVLKWIGDGVERHGVVS